MIWEWNRRLRQPGRAVAAGGLALCLVLAGCGDDDDDDVDTVGLTEETPVIGGLADASPGAGRGTVVSLGRPQDANSVTVTITEDGLDPATITGQAGLPFILIVEGDREEHTLAIENLVSETTVAAEGTTEVNFHINEATTGRFPITLDGEEVGTFVAQAPGGIVEE